MVDPATLIPVAETLKLFGNNGTLVIKFRPDALKIFKETEPVFAIMDGIPVPFFIATFQARGTDRAHVLFDFIYRESQALELVGKTLYQIGKVRRKKHEQFTGFGVSDQKLGYLGIVDTFMDWHLNPCLNIRRINSAETFLVPFQEAFILNIDLKAKHILVSLPEGLTEIN